MSVKHIQKHYEKICAQYIEMRDNLKEMEELAANKMVPPETIENLKRLTQPIMENWERWSYMMFLLHMPNRKEKEKGYEKRKKAFLNKLKKENSPNSLLEKGIEVNKELKKTFKEN